MFMLASSIQNRPCAYWTFVYMPYRNVYSNYFSIFFVCMVYCMCVGYTHLNMNTCAHPFVCTCEGQSRTLGVLLSYFLPHCLERRSPTELEVCCPSCVGCLVVCAAKPRNPLLLGFEPKSSWLQSKSYHWAIFPAPFLHSLMTPLSLLWGCNNIFSKFHIEILYHIEFEFFFSFCGPSSLS